MADALDEGLPRALALTWGVAEHPQRGPKRELSIERIVESSIAIADADGLAAVTMSKVAASLGFTTMSLYRYVTSKDELLMLMQDAACAVAVPPEDEQAGTEPPGWRAGLRLWVRTLRGVYEEHPWMADIPVSQIQLLTPNNLLIVDWGLRAMRDVALSGPEKMSLLLVLSSLARTFGRLAQDIDEEWRKDEGAISRLNEVLTELIRPERFPDLYPLVRDGEFLGDPATGGPGVPPDDGAGDGYGIADDFDFGLSRILDGLAHHVENSPTADAPPRPTPPQVEDASAYSRDKAVREAAKARREAEVKLREARKRENEAVKRARERAAKS